MFDEAVVAGVAAFREGDEPPTDDEVMSRLHAAGVRPWLAERLLLFLPLAYGRRVLSGVRLQDTFVDGDTVRPLHGEPVFVAAAERAAMAGRADIERIGLRSSEFAAVNNALHDGARLDDLEISAVVFARPLPPPGDDDGGVPSPAAIFAAFLTAHGLPVDAAPAGGSPGGGGSAGGSLAGDSVAGHLKVGEAAFSARLIAHSSPAPGALMVQVDVAIDHPALAEPWMVESCAGAGPTWREAIHQAMDKFERGVVHPVVEALLSRGAAADQVSWDPYDHPSGAFELCLGAQLVLFTAEPVPPAAPLLDRLLAELRNVPLSQAVHALRVFTCHRDGRLITNELLLDGEPWEAGARVIADFPPPLESGMVGQRLFGLLVPATS